MIQAGRFDQRISISERAATVDAIGQPVETWALVAAVWANIRMVSGVESIKAGAETAIAKASMRIRYRAGLNEGMRVEHGTDIYDIKAVLLDPGKQYADLVCERVR